MNNIPFRHSHRHRHMPLEIQKHIQRRPHLGNYRTTVVFQCHTAQQTTVTVNVDNQALPLEYREKTEARHHIFLPPIHTTPDRIRRTIAAVNPAEINATRRFTHHKRIIAAATAAKPLQTADRHIHGSHHPAHIQPVTALNPRRCTDCELQPSGKQIGR